MSSPLDLEKQRNYYEEAFERRERVSQWRGAFPHRIRTSRREVR